MRTPQVIVVAKRSAYAQLTAGEGDPRARVLLERKDPSVRHWMAAHNEHMKTLEAVEKTLSKLGVRALMLIGAHAAFDAGGAALVVTVGGDGTLLAASHNIASVPILGVNSAPKHSVGFFCAARRSNLQRMLSGSLSGKVSMVRLARMEVAVNGQVRSRRVLNEALFSHASPAATSHYLLRKGRITEEQRSSGFWIGPAAGSTAAQRSAGGRVLPLTSRKLQLVVREPYVRPGRAYRLLRVLVGEHEHITAQSQMQQSSLFLDGPYREISVRLGDVLRFRVSDQPLSVLGLTARRKRE